MSEVLSNLHAGRALSQDEARVLALAMADGSLSPDEITRALIALRDRGETPDEVAGFAHALRTLAKGPGIDAGLADRAVDIVGTGGDNAGTHNISTASALLVAACGTPVIKHGNRASSSRSGSADVLAALGLPTPMSPEMARECLERTGFTFLFAPAYHPALVRLAPIRKAIGTRTIFNVLGPLTNPACPAFALIGAYSPGVARLMADALARGGIRGAGVVHSHNGLDEATGASPFSVLGVGHCNSAEFFPAALGVSPCTLDDLKGGDAEHNGEAIRTLFERGSSTPADLRALREAVELNAALALVISRSEALSSATIREQLRVARAAIDDGRGARLLAQVRTFASGQSEAQIAGERGIGASVSSPKGPARAGAAGDGAMGDFLTEMARASVQRCDRDRQREPLAALEARARAAVPAPVVRLAGFDLIAEIKPASPSQGVLVTHESGLREIALRQAHAYASGGAAIISVLTEPTRFGGSDELLRAVSAGVSTPTMRKDFLVDPYQVVQARADGAAGVLLITRMLSDTQAKEMLIAAREHGLFVLIEAFDEADIERGARLGAGMPSARHASPATAPVILMGLNTRNLADLTVDATRLERLASELPAGFPRVAESGMDGPADAERVARLGYDLALVGTALMRSHEPERLCRAMIDAGRSARAGAPMGVLRTKARL